MTIAGPAFVVLFVAGGVLLGELLGTFGDPDATFDEYFAERGNRARDIVGGYLLAASGMVLIWFAVQLRRALRVADNEASWPDVAGLAGALAGLLIVVAAAALMTVSLSMAFGRGFGDTGQFASGAAGPPQLGYVLLCALAVIPAAAMIVASSIVTLKERSAPRWVSYAGFPLAAFLLLGLSVGPLVALPIWVAAATFSLRRLPATPST
ncbi:MAG: hypothetical protein WEB52_15840 [Dehalococcoidia bacterium]